MHSGMRLDNKVLLGRLYERTSQKGNRCGKGQKLFFDDPLPDILA